ncbi:ATP-binding protein [Actinosynnema sp. NPDC020468]|uniref:ATP-binding protein n=1 Tax=Actinosynnema sp. NPDC020468 TaxID=3154488 RepID=UPI00340E3F90
MKITPSARILKMLGEIEFDPWQCIAELIDNSFDDFTEIVREGKPWAGGFKVSVTLPALSAKAAEARILIEDSGRGMSYERLEQSVRAGWSSNDRFDKLGLFGMGFNVSTARLGRRTRVLTTRAGDPNWIGVEIDLDRIGDDYEAEDITEPKDDPNEHGTRVEISKLHPERAGWLQRNAANLRTTLGKTYSWILDNRPFELWVQRVQVKPRRHCRWGDDRFVVYGGGASSVKIPAYIEIDQKFDPAEACADCGNWQSPEKGRCDECGGARLVRRERRIHGWLGVQRHLDKREFGVDFMRNGRKILQWDKQLFDWKNPNDPLGLVDTEYPIELANQGGRLIGEIHLDHVPVTYQKNAFEYTDRSWRAAVDYLRGVGPLQPEKAKRASYPDNTSPLGILFKGYRRNAAGLRCLVPGDGTRPIHEETRKWAQKFHQGDPAFQSDERWYEAVVNHEEQGTRAKLHKAQAHTAPKADEDAVREALGLDLDSSEPERIVPESPVRRPETFQDRLVRYGEASTLVPELSRDFGLPRLGHLEVETRRLAGLPLTDANGEPAPVLLVQGAGGTATAFLDSGHEAFVKLGVQPAELLLVEIAAVLKVRGETGRNHAQLVTELRGRCLPDTVVDFDVISAQAREVLTEVRRLMTSAVESDAGRAYQYLSPDELTTTENEVIANGRPELLDKLGVNGEFLLYVPPLFIVRLLESWPEAFMDGKVFRGPYAGVSSPSAQRLSLARVAGYLNDVATLVSFNSRPAIAQLQRTLLSIKLLADEFPEES